LAKGQRSTASYVKHQRRPKIINTQTYKTKIEWKKQNYDIDEDLNKIMMGYFNL
jgi:hypothetical protein